MRKMFSLPTNVFFAAIAGFSIISLVGCKTLPVGSLLRTDAKFQWTNSLFVELPKSPKNKHRKSVYVQARKADASDIGTYRIFKAHLKDKGYQVTTDHERTAIFIQAHTMLAGETKLRVLRHALAKGYGAQLLGLNEGDEEDNSLVSTKGFWAWSNFFKNKEPSAEDKLIAVILDLQLLVHQDDGEWKRHQTRLVVTDTKGTTINEKVPALVEAAVEEIVKFF